jgi:hypothetical protein
MSHVLQKNKDIVYADWCVYKNEIDFVDKLLDIYSVVKMDSDNQLRKFEKDVLSYYIRFGYSTETKKMINKKLDKSKATITQATFYLSKKGYLIPSKTNLSQKKLNSDLQRLRDSFIDGNKKILALGFKRK